MADPFTPEEVDRARRYHRAGYLTLPLGVVLSVTTLVVLSFGSWGDRLYRLLGPFPWWGRTLAFAAVVVAISFAVRLPLSLWRGYLHERKWGFSTQRLLGWFADRAKGLVVGLVLISGAMLGLILLARVFPGGWPLAAAPAGACLILVLSFVAPVILEPIFHRFAPVAEQRLAEDLRALAARAGVPVRDVLAADASRRTRKENAYVSGLGRTRRVVVYDTLLARARPQVRLVVAHELGHRRMRHVAKGTALGMAGIILLVFALWALLRDEGILGAIGARAAGDPRVVPFVLLVGTALNLLSLPLRSALSRRWERDADRFSLELTQDAQVFEDSHRALALANLSDLAPPRFVYLALFTHPSPPERIAAARRWARQARPPPTTA
ncbi:MAG: M48 family metallopeptidase [Actinomycetota bacterium]